MYLPTQTEKSQNVRHPGSHVLILNSFRCLSFTDNVNGSYGHALKGINIHSHMGIEVQYIAWVSFLISLSAFFRDRPSVSRKSGKGPWMAIMVSCSSLLIAYMYFTPPFLLSFVWTDDDRSLILPTPQRNLLSKLASPAGAPSPSPVGTP
jgi:hypothetical protein